LYGARDLKNYNGGKAAESGFAKETEALSGKGERLARLLSFYFFPKSNRERYPLLWRGQGWATRQNPRSQKRDLGHPPSSRADGGYR
jgi:hypothetical protein